MTLGRVCTSLYELARPGPPFSSYRRYRGVRNEIFSIARNASRRGEQKEFACFASVSRKSIIVYSKEDCPLCDGLKDKISGILDRAPFTGSKLKDYTIEVRDILTNPSWEEKYSMQIPVMAVQQNNGNEVRFFISILPTPFISKASWDYIVGHHTENVTTGDI